MEGGGRQQEAAAVARLVHTLLARRVHVHKSTCGAAGGAATEVPVHHALAVVQPVLGPYHARTLAAQQGAGASCPAHCGLGHHGAASCRGPRWPWWGGESLGDGWDPRGQVQGGLAGWEGICRGSEGRVLTNLKTEGPQSLEEEEE